ncbi:FAD:protein FMN transferase [Mesohalobacter halotolerans]|uniref:FAD:protein FMN transferase n=1 Tax=Mesohalobacter halotolerans TaxID=1883405 RepID=A0A4U5TNH7_9FLAO|nr:FAD:protein FMN transferase [Mesohalobacter halotolerans]MBS3738172.1 FAD:protein FMN transferase [Psychroflexus sp.]TKS55559.1 FAD:protein FMN transferase [Mesohalobacter halotolerans]
MITKVYILMFCIGFQFSIEAQEIHKRSLGLMGSNFDITVVAQNQTQAQAYIDTAVNEIYRIEKLISSWKPESQTSAINRNAGIQPVKVDKELFDLIKRSKGISQLTDGAFDISFAAIEHIFSFKGQQTTWPSQDVIDASVKNISYQNIVLDEKNQTVFLKYKGMRIGFGAIGKGYAADKAKALLVEKGVSGGIINASGDMNTWGTQPDGSAWKVAITNPMDKTKNFGLFDLNREAVVTSGNYEKFIMVDGQRYAHIIDPRTGMPTQGIISATVFAPKAELADALATSIFVMGSEVGINLINQLPGVEAIIVKDDGTLVLSNKIKIKSK